MSQITQLEKQALAKNENLTYALMQKYYSISNLKNNKMTIEDYEENLKEIIGEN